ncbi:SMODS domain-containing nucleotidyltransferase [Holdemania filiformis]|uniref:SMODS domain-containing nucleotidyltransferase n=1 Tax=Holdemania filiformis TaxID=61171 RepID=UPI00242E006F|nr:nucleotidyltransferase domain-containing protein [Holdemania filiformis]
MSDRVQKYGERISQQTRSLISLRYHTVTRAINNEFWNSSSDTSHSLYVGSYGRNTAIDTSDIDILVELPSNQFDRFNNLSGNGQSRLLQTVRRAILNVYPRSDVRADGQVVKIAFSDGMDFEIVPAFKSWDGSYKYPDSNMGGNWKSTNPKAEQEAMAQKNRYSNGLLYDTCRHLRFIRDNYFSSYHLSGIVIDSFVYNAIGDWRWLNSGESSTQPSGTYEQVLLDYYNRHNTYWGMTLYAPGSNDSVSTESSVECLGKVLRMMV